MKNTSRRISQWKLIFQFLSITLPQVERELKDWEKRTEKFYSPVLQRQARASIRLKKFHCQGGSFFTLLNPGRSKELLKFIVSFQTISDYLDNLCDRVNVNELAFRGTRDKDSLLEEVFYHLHFSMLTSLMPEKSPHINFYELYPCQGDGGYLISLAQESQDSVRRMPGYERVREKLLFLANLYCELQSKKHLSYLKREKVLKEWFEQYEVMYPFLFWNEFAAAAGSTLCIFALLAHASLNGRDSIEEERVFNLYFPWVCCLHILLDYYIDQEEDIQGNDLNFIYCYGSRDLSTERLSFFARKSLQKARATSNASFHCTVIKGLLALYLSDPKIQRQRLEDCAREIIDSTGESDIFYLYKICRLMRRAGVL